MPCCQTNTSDDYPLIPPIREILHSHRQGFLDPGLILILQLFHVDTVHHVDHHRLCAVSLLAIARGGTFLRDLRISALPVSLLKRIGWRLQPQGQYRPPGSRHGRSQGPCKPGSRRLAFIRKNHHGTLCRRIVFWLKQRQHPALIRRLQPDRSLRPLGGDHVRIQARGYHRPFELSRRGVRGTVLRFSGLLGQGRGLPHHYTNSENAP